MFKKIVFIDMDNTLFDFSSQTIKYSKIHNYKLIDSKINKTYDFSFWFKEKDKIKEIINNFFGNYLFWYEMPSFYLSYETLKFLNKNFKVYIATSPSFQYIESFKGKIDSIKHNYPFINIEKQLIFINQKQLLKGDYLIDDSPKNIENSNIKNILIPSYYYNEYLHKDHFSFNKWIDVFRYFKKEIEN